MCPEHCMLQNFTLYFTLLFQYTQPGEMCVSFRPASVTASVSQHQAETRMLSVSLTPPGAISPLTARGKEKEMSVHVRSLH